MNTWAIILFLLISSQVGSNHVSVCITNCGQCKKMLGPYFKGPACAHSCLATYGLYSPDCNNPTTLRAFLKRLY